MGGHRELLAYLVRRLLEKGANSSFVNQSVDAQVAAATIAADPFLTVEAADSLLNPAVKLPTDLFAPARVNSRGWDLRDSAELAALNAARAEFADYRWQVAPSPAIGGGQTEPRDNPVSSNHLRAHETRLTLVCPLLLVTTTTPPTQHYAHFT